MSTALDDLCLRLRPQVVEVLARLIEARVMVMLVCITRTPAEHTLNVAAGTSATAHSKHVPASNAACPQCHGTKSHAVDLCPYETWELHGSDKAQWRAGTWDKMPAEWATIVRLGKATGLRSGRDWGRSDESLRQTPPKPFDPGHLELPGT